MNTHKTKLPSIQQISNDYSQFSFESADTFYWSPKDQCIYYINNEIADEQGVFQLFHELGHACHSHRYFNSGVHLLKIESEAWQEAVVIAKKYGMVLPPERIESSLDTYRDWLHRRSTCPRCDSVSVEKSANHYHCFTCSQDWTVPDHQQTRCYRQKLDPKA